MIQGGVTALALLDDYANVIAKIEGTTPEVVRQRITTKAYELLRQ